MWRRFFGSAVVVWHTFGLIAYVVRVIQDRAAFSRQTTTNKQFIHMTIKPLADRVLIKAAAAEEKTVGGIIIPDTAKEKPLQGEVLAVGGGTKDEEMVLKVGDRVLYGKYSGTEVELDGEKYLIMRQSDVLAVLA